MNPAINNKSEFILISLLNNSRIRLMNKNPANKKRPVWEAILILVLSGFLLGLKNNK
jgi:hypothetical protein